MLNAPDLDRARPRQPATRASAPDQVAIRFESQTALERALSLAQAEPWVAACRIEPASRTLHLKLCSGAASEGPARLH